MCRSTHQLTRSMDQSANPPTNWPNRWTNLPTHWPNRWTNLPTHPSTDQIDGPIGRSIHQPTNQWTNLSTHPSTAPINGQKLWHFVVTNCLCNFSFKTYYIVLCLPWVIMMPVAFLVLSGPIAMLTPLDLLNELCICKLHGCKTNKWNMILITCAAVEM